MNQYQKAYSILGLDPGSSKETIQTRWKRLAMVWHPDRFPSDEGKKDAEEELKKINNAKDVLWAHFDSPAHKPNGCDCQQPIGSQRQTAGQPPPEPRPGPGPGPGRKSNAEAEAERRDAERKAKAAAEEAARQAQGQAKKEEQPQTFEQAQTQQANFDDAQLRWKIAKVLAAVFLAMCGLGWIGGAIGDGIRHTASTISNTITTVTKENKNDPCDLVGPQTSPPAVILPTLISGVKEQVSLWDIKCYGTGGGASVHGRDAQNRDVVWQEYGPNWSLDHQDIVKAQGNEIVVDRYKMPGDFQGRCTYKYDDGSLIEANQVDSQQNSVIALTVERRRNGRPSVIVKPAGGNTTTYYDLSGTDAKSRFYLGERYMQIKDYVESPTALTSPEGVPSIQPGPSIQPDTGTNGPNPFRIETDSRHVGPNPFSTSTQTGDNSGHLSPSPFGTSSGGPSLTPGTDALMQKLNQQKSQ